jgi:hypothetical protein
MITVEKGMGVTARWPDRASRETKRGSPMELSRATAKIPRSRQAIECAQCGEHLFAPEWSEYVDARRVRHLWECEACGYAFETTIRFAA